MCMVDIGLSSLSQSRFLEMRPSFGYPGPHRHRVWANFLLIFLILSLFGSGLQKSIFSRKLSKDFASGKTIVLQSSDGETFDVEEAVAIQSLTIKHMIELDNCADTIPLRNVTSKILAKVIEYCEHHVEAAALNGTGKLVEDELKKFDADFVRVDHNTLFDLILAANYLKIESLLELASQTVGDMMKGKTPGEIRKMFNITNECTSKRTLEDEEEFVRENRWSFE